MTKAEPTRRRPLQPRLGVQLALVLSIAILPLGLISVFQTYSVLKEREALSTTALLDATQLAVAPSRQQIRSAIGAAETLAILVTSPGFSTTACNQAMRQLVELSGWFMFAGYHQNDRGVVCSSHDFDNPQDLANALPRSDSMVEEILMTPLEVLGGVSTVNVTIPVIKAGELFGTIWIAIPAAALNESLSETDSGAELVLFQEDGEIVATEMLDDNRRSVLPEGKTLKQLANEGRQAFRDRNRSGVARDFAIAPIVDDHVFALGSWEPQESGLSFLSYQRIMALYFPIVMWIVAIVVAYVGVQRLVIRHIRRLQLWMRLYAKGGKQLEDARLDNAPEELEVVAHAFRNMTRRLSEQERLLESDLKEKTILLREVHHRVKNNLQLISSMMNMQIRATDSPEAKQTLRRVQDRVMALSAIHRYLYLARRLSRLRADELLEEIIQHLVVVGSLEEAGHHIKVNKSLDRVEISPDQSVPLSLLVTEAATNAVKYCGASGDTEAWISISLKKVGEDRVSLTIANSLGTSSDAPGEPGGTGLGGRLIASFVAQLNGKLDVKRGADRYEMELEFPLLWAAEDEEEAAA